MKRIFTSVIIITSLTTYAQPVIQNGSNMPAVGVNTPFLAATTSSPGSAGANATWDFSGVPFTRVGTMEVLQPSSAPHDTSFPTANYVLVMMPLVGDPMYSYLNVGANRMEMQAYSISSPGGSTDYSSDPRSMMNFPFAFNDSLTDTWAGRRICACKRYSEV